MKNNFIEDNILIISKQTMDLFLAQKNPSDLISLYLFYYYTAKWQKTNQPKSTTSYTAKALGWGNEKLIKNKKILKNLDLIDDIRIKDEKNHIIGWYIKINYIWKQKTHSTGFPQSGSCQRVAKSETNALSVNSLNALSDNRKMLIDPILDISNQDISKSIEKENGDNKTGGAPTSEESALIQFWIDEWTKVYSKKPIVTNWGRYVKQARPFIKNYGLEKCKDVCKKYFITFDKFYSDNNWPLNIFLSDQVFIKLA